MSLLDILFLALIAGVCGGLGQSIAGRGGTGCVATIALGFIGALIGMWLARVLSLPEIFTINVGGEVAFPIIWSIAGSALFVAALGLFNRRPME